MQYLHTLAVMSAAVLLAGCAATKPTTPIEQTIPIRTGDTSVTIIAPQEQYLPAQAFSTFTDYEYFLDCPDERCKIGRMHMLQYITISPAAGKHTLWVKLAPEGVVNTIAITGTDPLSVVFEAVPDKRIFISHAFEASLSSLLIPIAAPTSSLSIVDDTAGHAKVQKVLDTTSIFGDKMAGFGEKGIVYDK
ncbi:MAG: hypothetical protein AB1763_09245 [Campylobacterota bacterium]